MSLEIKNLMEDIVMQNLDVVLEGAGCCTCDACRSDVAAWTLNNLKPHYVATRQGRLMVKLQNCELQSRADVIAAISEAALMVKSNPRHGRE